MAAPRGAYRRLMAMMNAQTQSEMSRVGAELGGDVASEKVQLQKDMRDFDKEIRRMRRSARERSGKKLKRSLLGTVVGGLIGGPAGAALGSFAGSRSTGQSIKGFERDYGQVQGKFLLDSKEKAADAYDDAVITLSDMNADSKLVDAFQAVGNAMSFNSIQNLLMPKYKPPIDLGAKIKNGMEKTFMPEKYKARQVEVLKMKGDANFAQRGFDIDVADRVSDIEGFEGIGSQKPGFVSLEDRMTSGFQLPTNLNANIETANVMSEPLLNPGRPNVPGLVEDLDVVKDLPLDIIPDEFNQGGALSEPLEPYGGQDLRKLFEPAGDNRYFEGGEGLLPDLALEEIPNEFGRTRPVSAQALGSGAQKPLFGSDSIFGGLLSKQQEFANKNKIEQLLRRINNPNAMPQSIERAKKELTKMGYDYGV